jgi:hypothetical protein
VGRSPIAHPEIAGEGIEYDWGAGKIYYCGQPIKDKWTLEKFLKLVKYCLSDAILLKGRVHLFVWHSRQYMLGYKAVSKQSEEQQASVEDGGVPSGEDVKMPHALIGEKCVSLFKKKRSHQNAVDFDSAFIEGVLRKMQDSSDFSEVG